MRRWIVVGFVTLSLIVFAASGSIRLQPEHQAYVICLGVEHETEGGIKLSALCPKISGETESEYLTFESTGWTIEEALVELERIVPRNLVYVQLKMLLLSEEFAASDGMNDLVYCLLMDGEFYSDAWVLTCSESPAQLLRGYHPVIGTRLSASILATMENAIAMNIVPSVHLTELLNEWNSIYGDVVAGSCHPQMFGEDVALIPDGASLFSNDRMAMRLNAEDTALMNWLCGGTGDVAIRSDDAEIRIRPDYPVHVRFDWDDHRIQINGHFVQRTQGDRIPLSDVERLIESRVERLIARCQHINADPFTFSELAARSCIDINAYKSLHFREFYQSAEVVVNVAVRDELS